MVRHSCYGLLAINFIKKQEEKFVRRPTYPLKAEVFNKYLKNAMRLKVSINGRIITCDHLNFNVRQSFKQRRCLYLSIDVEAARTCQTMFENDNSTVSATRK